MISDGFSVWSFIVSLLASSSITKSVPEPTYESNDKKAIARLVEHFGEEEEVIEGMVERGIR